MLKIDILSEDVAALFTWFNAQHPSLFSLLMHPLARPVGGLCRKVSQRNFSVGEFRCETFALFRALLFIA